jgi:hypothetical protein
VVAGRRRRRRRHRHPERRVPVLACFVFFLQEHVSFNAHRKELKTWMSDANNKAYLSGF